MVVSSVPDGDDSRAWSGRLAASGRSGAIIVTSQLTPADQRNLDRARLPFVLIDPAGELPDPSVATVGATNWAGGLSAVRHLLGLGHRRIGVIGGHVAMLCSRARISGYAAALASAGIEVDPALIRHGNFHHVGGYQAARELFELPDPPTAIFAGSDEQAFGVAEAARVTGRRIPEDLSVVGFDDLPISRWFSPPLTTVRQPLAEMGRIAAAMLSAMIDGRRAARPPGGAGHRARRPLLDRPASRVGGCAGREDPEHPCLTPRSTDEPLPTTTRSLGPPETKGAPVPTELHVATTGSDHADGSADPPFRTINRAAALAQPGDTVVVHGGEYREWVQPPTRRAQRPAPHHLHRRPRRARRDQGLRAGHRLGAGRRRRLDRRPCRTACSATFNPFAEEVDGDWIVYADPSTPKKHLGDVYLNGTSFYEVSTLERGVATRRCAPR